MSVEGLPNQDERRKIIERARKRIREARALAERLDRLDMEIACRTPQISIQFQALYAQAA